ncbi:MAG: hypothetical protein ACLQBA_04445, partial [Candidatus Binataceae bacterium]
MDRGARFRLYLITDRKLAQRHRRRQAAVALRELAVGNQVQPETRPSIHWREGSLADEPVERARRGR